MAEPREPEDARPRLLAGAAAIVVSAVLVTLVALLVRDSSGTVVRWDQSVLRTTTAWSLDHPWLRRTADVGAYVLHPFVFRLAVLGVAVVLWRRRGRAAALWATITMVVGTLLGALLKEVVQRARPELDTPVGSAGGFSFPSGHALNAALGVTVLLVLLWRPLARRRRRLAALAVGLLLVLLTGLDRLLLGVHFPSDVVAGYLVGSSLVASSWVAFGSVLRERTRRQATRVADQTVPPDPAHPPARRQP